MARILRWSARIIQINGHPFTVIGVAPPGFYGAKLAGWGMPDIWLPLTTELVARRRKRRGSSGPNENCLDLLGRVRPGVNPQALEAKLRVEFHDWLASHVPDMEPGEKQLWQQQTLHLIPGGAGVAAMRDRIRGWTEAAADRGRMRAAGGLRQPGESDAGARVERTARRPRSASRWALRAAGWCARRWWRACCWRSSAGIWHRRGVWRNATDSVSGLPDRRPE